MTSHVPVPHPLLGAGVSVWLDDLSRQRIVSGALARDIRERHVVGVTTNPAIFRAAITSSTDYDDAIADASHAHRSADHVVHDLVVADVRDACDILSEVHRDTKARDGYVSLEVDPRLAHDTDATIEAAVRLHADVDRPNVMIKIPATRAGLPAISAVLAQGINVNVTLIFSTDRYRDVLAAHAEGLRRAADRGVSLPALASVASVFVSRMDSALDPRLASGSPLRGRAAVANALLAYADHRSWVESSVWSDLAALGAQPQRPLWASTGTKDPAYPATKYVVELATPGAVNTMPAATLEAVMDDRTPIAPVQPMADGLRLDLESVLRESGREYGDVVTELEAAGVQAFVDAWTELLGSVDERLAAATRPSPRP